MGPNLENQDCDKREDNSGLGCGSLGIVMRRRPRSWVRVSHLERDVVVRR